ncbi:hypothetical protein E2C01_057419 [Portunus trituberculatus]|uniref:Uncharacterized protein n=1 Tax=Portunus trituberculatus TaxID=210409 RepID=A0A5B7GSU2_PORTR|nr:hypothetical protein [Portunus trituberculatus]
MGVEMFISGEVVVAIKPGELPVPGVHFVLGNDLAGNLAVPNLIVLDSPLTKNPTKTLDETSPHFFPVCAVTRSQPKSPAFSPPPPPMIASTDNLYNNIISKENLINTHFG